MTTTIGSSSFTETTAPARLNVPMLPSWAVPRRLLAARLDLGVSGLLTLVTGPAGSGKTLGVASWATSVDVSGGLIWVSLAGTEADPDFLWQRLGECLADAGAPDVVTVPTSGRTDRLRSRTLAQLGIAARRTSPWIVVLDGFPTGRPGRLGKELQVVLEHARRGIRLVVISRGEPAIDVQRHHVSGELSRITAGDLAMDAREVADLLAGHGVEGSEITARAVERHTAGWACGVRLAAVALPGAPTIEAALDECDRASTDYVRSEVLDTTPDAVRELIVRTSMVDDVSPEVARAVLGPNADGARAALVDDGWVSIRHDGSFRCHPLFRAAAFEQLTREPTVADEDRLRVIQWYAGHGEVSLAIELATAAEDWPCVARLLVESYAVPRILAGNADAVVESALAVDAVREAEPLLHAAAALSEGHRDVAGAALARITVPPEAAAPADELSSVLVALGVARLGGRSVPDDVRERARMLVAQLPAQRHAEFSPLLDALVGAVEIDEGRVHEAAITLERGGGRSTASIGPTGAALDCLGQLAMVDAFRGNLRVAHERATLVLDQAGTGATSAEAHAHLATAWVHLERNEPAEVRHHLELARAAARSDVGPWFVAVVHIVHARLLAMGGQAHTALRQLVPVVRAAQDRHGAGWPTDLLVVALAEAFVAAGEPRRAIELLDPLPGTATVEARVLAASALLDLGERARSVIALDAVAGEVGAAPLEIQIEAWLTEARIAHDGGDPTRTHLLIDRALDSASAEHLRRPFALRSEWLATTVDRDPTLRRTHGGFLPGLRPAAFRQSGGPTATGGSAVLPIERLTARESQVLGLLAEMCSTNEIARELFLSVNTVKTYVRGILRKLSVNRRVDAVRRGRELGLC